MPDRTAHRGKRADRVESWPEYVREVESDPLIHGLLACLPPDGTYWPESRRKLWLDLAERLFALRYSDKPQVECPTIWFVPLRDGRLACEARWRPSSRSGGDFRWRQTRTVIDLDLDAALHGKEQR